MFGHEMSFFQQAERMMNKMQKNMVSEKSATQSADKNQQLDAPHI